MKIRTGFVSNLSSSSFIIKKKKLSKLQRYLINNHIDVGAEFGLYGTDNDRWSIHETEKYIELETQMDNFDMHEFLLEIGVKEKYIK